MPLTDTSHDSAQIPRFFGLSSDTKPTNAMVDSQFLETDTGTKFVWNGTTWTIPAQTVQLTASPSSASGQTPYFDSDGDNTVKTIKSSGGVLYFLEVSNTNSADAYIQLFDESGAITVGSTTPALSLVVPAGVGALDGAMDKFWAPGLAFDNSIKYACTTTATGNGDPSVGLVVNAGFA